MDRVFWMLHTETGKDCKHIPKGEHVFNRDLRQSSRSGLVGQHDDDFVVAEMEKLTQFLPTYPASKPVRMWRR